ncbi:MAG: hypothetical protein ACLQDV_06000 [Candidatus Binataceae bacterium]
MLASLKIDTAETFGSWSLPFVGHSDSGKSIFVKFNRTLVTDQEQGLFERLCNDDREIKAYHKLLHVRTESLIDFKWWAVKAVAKALLKHKSLTPEAIVSTIHAARSEEQKSNAKRARQAQKERARETREFLKEQRRRQVH